MSYVFTLKMSYAQASVCVMCRILCVLCAGLLVQGFDENAKQFAGPRETVRGSESLRLTMAGSSQSKYPPPLYILYIYIS